MVAPNLKYKKFGRLTVLSQKPSSKIGDSLWLCKCICGNEKIILGKNLRAKVTKSCGCLKQDHMKKIVKRNRLGYKEASLNSLIRRYKLKAKKKNINFNLFKTQFKTITSKECYYCGIKPKQKVSKNGYFGNYIYNGIDRKNSKFGYTIKNSLPCCWICNRAKGNLTYKNFINWLTRIKRNNCG